MRKVVVELVEAALLEQRYRTPSLCVVAGLILVALPDGEDERRSQIMGGAPESADVGDCLPVLDPYSEISTHKPFISQPGIIARAGGSYCKLQQDASVILSLHLQDNRMNNREMIAGWLHLQRFPDISLLGPMLDITQD